MSRFKGTSEWLRRCPECGTIMYYSSKYSLANANNSDSLCSKCANTGSRNGMFGRIGDTNPFFGRKHNEESLSKMSKIRKEWFAELPEGRKETIKDHLAFFRQNSRPRLSNYQYWVRKHGEEEANRKLIETKKKHSKASSGSNNPMFGKPSPKGSGNGWTGWYKGIYFRSLGELTFMINNPNAEPAESNRWRATYISYTGQERTTVPDFVIETEKTVYECKPARLHSTPLVILKAKAMEDHVKSMGYQYKITDPGYLEFDALKSLIDIGLVVLSDKSKEKLKKWEIKLSS